MERKITIEESEIYEDNYQMRMLRENPIDGLLPIRGRGVNAKSRYDYNVSGMISMKVLFDRNKLQAEKLRLLLESMDRVRKQMEEYLLPVDKLLLDPEYIFYDGNKFYFCYYPPGKGEFWSNFHSLVEYLVKETDYSDEPCVRMTFLLHKDTMEENHSFRQLLEACLAEEKEEKKPAMPGMIREEILYDTEEHDWTAEQKKASVILKETDNMWSPVKRFLTRHGRKRNMDWDQMFLDEFE